MSSIASNSEDLILNADGGSSTVKFKIDGTEKASISSAGAFTSTTIDATKLTGNLPAISGANLTGVGVSGISSSADATAMTTSSSEDVGINHSTGFGTYSGTGIKSSKGDGTFFVGRDGGQPLWLNRETSQGDLIGLAAAGSTYARIGTDSNDLVLKTGTGGNTERMRILADGGLTFNGDTAAANALDDYEEGSHNTVWTASSSGTITPYRSQMAYTKIGRVVHMTGEVEIASVSSPTGSTRFTLPFVIATADSQRNMNFGGAVFASYHINFTENNPPVILAHESESFAKLVYQRNDSSFVDFQPAAGDTFFFSFSYFTTS